MRKLQLQTLEYLDINDVIEAVGIDPGTFETPEWQDYQKVIVSQTFTHRENGSYYGFNYERAISESTLARVKEFFQKADEVTKEFQDHGYLTLHDHW